MDPMEEADVESSSRFANMTDTDLLKLFDLSTVDSSSDSNHGNKEEKIKKIIVRKDELVFVDDRIEVHKKAFVKFVEVKENSPGVSAIDPTKLKLPLVHGCDLRQTGVRPVMPLLRLEMLDTEYFEPIRDRDKNWAVESGRRILNRVAMASLDPGRGLDLGKYENLYSSSPSFWSPEFRSMLKKKRLFRKATVVSNTNCIVDVYGIGITGRIFSEGSQAGKLLVIDVYSAWNNQNYVLVLSLLKVRVLLASRPDLLQAGKRPQLLEALFKRLYFQYHIIYKAAVDPKTTPKQISPYVTVVVNHLEKPNLPNGYPKTIEEMIRSPPVPVNLPDTQYPIITQELMISGIERENIHVCRQRERKEKRRLAEEEARRLYQIWLATPRRNRDLVCRRAARLNSKILIISAYHRKEMRPLSLDVIGFSTIECVNLDMNLSLLRIRQIGKIDLAVASWEKDLIQASAKSVMRFFRLDHASSGFSSLSMTTASSAEIVLGKRRNISDLGRKFKAIVSRHTYHNSYHHPTIIHSVDHSNELPVADALLGDNYWDNLRLEYMQSTCSTWNSLGFKGSARRTPKPLGGPCPRRFIGRGVLLTSRCKRISGVHSIVSLFLGNRKLFRGPLPKWNFDLPLVEIDDKTAVGIEVGSEGYMSVDELSTNKSAEAISSPPRKEVDVDFQKSYSYDYSNDEDDDFDFTKAQDDEEQEEDVEGEEDEQFELIDEVDILDLKNAEYEKMCKGMVLLVEVVIPFESMVMQKNLPAGACMNMILYKEDIMRLVPDHKIFIKLLSSLYYNFSEQAAEEEVKEVELLWDGVGNMIASKLYWKYDNQSESGEESKDILTKTFSVNEQLELSSRFLGKRGDFVDIAESNNPIGLVSKSIEDKETLDTNLDVEFDEMYAYSADSYLNEFDFPLEQQTSLGDMGNHNRPVKTDGISYIDIDAPLLTIRNTIFSKALKITSEAPSRPGSVRLFVNIWMCRNQIGVVCFDHEICATYSAQQSNQLQTAQIANLRFGTLEERNSILRLWLTSDLRYSERHEKEMVHEGYVYFSEENTETVLENVVENDYTDTAGDAVAIAEEKAKKRKESRMKYEEQEKRKKGSMSLFSN